MSKRALVEAIVADLDRELKALLASAKAAHEAATHEESRAEDAHDTRGLEASYLAGAQAARADNLRKVISQFQSMKPRDFGAKEAIAPGALVELRLGARKLACFLVALGGGSSITLGGQVIQLVTVQSPLGEALLGRHAGDVAEVETQGDSKEYEIIRVS